MIPAPVILAFVLLLSVIAGCVYYLITSHRDHRTRVRAEMSQQTVNGARAAYIDDANDAAWRDVEATFAKQDRDWSEADRIAADPALRQANFAMLIAGFDLDEATQIQRVLELEVRP